MLRLCEIKLKKIQTIQNKKNNTVHKYILNLNSLVLIVLFYLFMFTPHYTKH